MIHKSSVILSPVDESKVSIGPFVYIGENVVLGNNVTIHPSVVIEDGAVIGDDVEIFPSAYIGKPPKGSAYGEIKCEKHLRIEKGCVIGPHTTIYYGDHIGECTLISEGVSIRENVSIGNHCIIGRNVTINYGVVIEDFVKIMDLSHLTARSVLRKYAFLAPTVSSAEDNSFGKIPNVLPEGGPIIEENASIGVGAVLLPRVRIGKDSIVGAGAVVTRDVEEGVLVTGSPARKRG